MATHDGDEVAEKSQVIDRQAIAAFFAKVEQLRMTDPTTVLVLAAVDPVSGKTMLHLDSPPETSTAEFGLANLMMQGSIIQALHNVGQKRSAIEVPEIIVPSGGNYGQSN